MGIATLGITKFFTTKILRHGNNERISYIFSPSNFPTWSSFCPNCNFFKKKLEKLISTYAEDLCNKKKAIIHQISKEKKNRHISTTCYSRGAKI